MAGHQSRRLVTVNGEKGLKSSSNGSVTLRCAYCRGQPAQLARSATRVWLGCRRCHHMWSLDADSCGSNLDANVCEPSANSLAEPTTPLRGAVIAVLASVLALGLRTLLRPVLGSASPFLLFTPAVAISAFYGGVASGGLATVFSTVLGSHFLLNDVGEPVLERWDRIVLFVLVGVVMTGSSTLLRRSRQELSNSLWREQKARAIAEAADRAKDDFLAVVSHELRTPMSVVMGWIETIRDRPRNRKTLDLALHAIDRNARILTRLVDDILDQSRIATGALRLDPQLISLSTVVHAAVDQMRARVESAGIHLETTVDLKGVSILGDSIRLQQVFTNLLSNAIKFTPSGGRISVVVSISQREAMVAVTDTGVGIPPDLLPHVFEAFRSGRPTASQFSQGLGLGLAIARYIIEQHQGWIAATSDGTGCGSSFTIALPLCDPSQHENLARASLRREEDSDRATAFYNGQGCTRP